MRYGIAIIIVAFLAIVGTVVLFGRSNSSSNSKKTSRFTKLADYESKDGTVVTMTQQGKLVGEDQRRAIRVTVTRTYRRVEILDGYEERTERSNDYPNTPDAYTTFSRALDHLSFGKERTVVQPDERAMCPLGNRFVYRLTNNSQEVMRTWSDTCSASDGPFAGTSASTVQQLFRLQIPDYNLFTSSVQL